MKINIEALRTRELKLPEYSKKNGTIAEHASENVNYHEVGCSGNCYGMCAVGCTGGQMHNPPQKPMRWVFM